jgi:DNA-damage-inducible protein D
MLGEAVSTEITRKRDARGLDENKTAARKGGRIAGEAREKLEAETGTSVV